MPFFTVSSGERRGIIVLCVVVVLASLVAWLVPKRHSDDKGRAASPSAYERSGSKPERPYAQPERKVETFPFDPNTADSTTLLRLGLTPSMVRGVYKYRSLGYTYSEPEDFSHVPGMTNEMWERLRPCIRIAERFRRVEPQPKQSNAEARETPSATRDTVRRSLKLRAGETIELNGSDTSALKRIPGIGPYYARQIVWYRERLGGFVSLSQLREVEGVPEGIAQYLTLDTLLVSKIDVNSASKRALIRHPYINVYLAEPIYDHVRRQGKLRSLDDLRQLPGVTEEDIQRLAPYLQFR